MKICKRQTPNKLFPYTLYQGWMIQVDNPEGLKEVRRWTKPYYEYNTPKKRLDHAGYLRGNNYPYKVGYYYIKADLNATSSPDNDAVWIRFFAFNE